MKTTIAITVSLLMAFAAGVGVAIAFIGNVLTSC